MLISRTNAAVSAVQMFTPLPVAGVNSQQHPSASAMKSSERSSALAAKSQLVKQAIVSVLELRFNPV